MTDLPGSVREVVERGIRDLDPDRVVLYGSRARGDARPASDYDLCFFGTRGLWAKYHLWVWDDAPGVYGFDVVRWEEAPEPLRKNIAEDGVTLYEKFVH